MTRERGDIDPEPSRSRIEQIARLQEAMDDMGWKNLRAAERMLGPYQLTFPQTIVMAILQAQGPDLMMAELADQTGLPASTITSIMDRLVQRGLVTRRHLPADRRRITGSITDEGVRILTELEERRRVALSDIMASFSRDELAVLTKLITRWTAVIEADTAES